MRIGMLGNQNSYFDIILYVDILRMYIIENISGTFFNHGN